jgi:hypothetical protein
MSGTGKCCPEICQPPSPDEFAPIQKVCATELLLKINAAASTQGLEAVANGQMQLYIFK